MYNELRRLNIKLNNNKLKVLLMHSPICFKDEKIYNKLKELDSEKRIPFRSNSGKTSGIWNGKSIPF